MIAALARMTEALAGPGEMPPETREVTRRKRTALFDVAVRFAEAAELARNSGRSVFAQAGLAERRKSSKLGFSLLAEGVHPDFVGKAFLDSGLARSGDYGERLEAEMVAAGVTAVLADIHPFVVFRVMTARLGLDLKEKADEWLLERIKRTRPRQDEIIVPGDLPEVLLRLAETPGEFGAAIRLAGHAMLAAALAGCPRESLLLVKRSFGKVGGAVFEDLVNRYRARLSTDEIGDAQSAFLDLLRELGKGAGSEPEDTGTEGKVDPALVRDLSGLVMQMDVKLLKAVASTMEPRRLAMIMQGIEPVAHDRVLTVIGKRREDRLIDALESAEPSGSFEILRAAQAFCQSVLAIVSPKGKPSGKPLPLPERVRTLMTAILSRE